MIRPGKSSTGYIWLRDALIPGENAILDALWIYPWISLALASTRSTAHLRFPFLWIAALLAVPALTGRWLERAVSGRRLLRRLALFLVAVALLILFVRTETLPGTSFATMRWVGEVLWPWAAHETPDRQNLMVFGWLLGWCLLIRGIWLAEAEVTGSTAPRWFLGGLAAFLILAVVLVHSPPAAYAADERWLGPMLALYVFLGVGWMALVQRRHVEEQTFRRGSDHVSRAWLALLAAIAGAVVLIAVMATALALLTLHPVEELAILTLGGIWQVITWIWDAILFVLGGILSLFGFLPHGSAHHRPTSPGHVTPPPPSRPGWNLPWLAPLLVAIVVIVGVPAVLCGIALIVYLAARFVLGGDHAEGTPADEESSVSLWSWSLFLTQLRGLARRLAGSWRTRRRGESRLEAGPDRPPPPSPTSIRGLYRSMLQFSRAQGRPRRLDETPVEFEPALAQQVPADLARRVTDAYVRARYGRVSLPADELEPVLDRWREYQREVALGDHTQ